MWTLQFHAFLLTYCIVHLCANSIVITNKSIKPMRTKRLLLAWLLAWLLPITVLADVWQDDQGVNYEYEPGSGVASVKYYWDDGYYERYYVTIPEAIYVNGERYVVKEIGRSAFSMKSRLKKVELPIGLITIGVSAFSGCSNLTTINITEGVTTIGESAFSGCSSLTSITIPSSVSIIASQTFQNCTSLSTINWVEGLTTLGEYNQEIKGETNVEIIPVIA